MNIVVTGKGIVSAIGLNSAQVLKSLQQGRSGIATMKHLPSVHKELPVGEVDLSAGQMKALAGVPASETASRTTLMGIMAVKQALTEAGITAGSHSSGTMPRVVLISGTTVGGMDLTEANFDKLESGDDCDFFREHDCGSCTRHIANHFGLFYDVTTISTACSSAANAMMLGARLIKAGKADIVVAGGTEALSRFHLNGFNSLMILDHEQCRPFDATRTGLNLGEGAAFVVLESEESALRRGAAVQAYLTGYGNACDAFHQTASSPDGEGAFLAMTAALDTAGITPDDVSYVNAHGTGTPNNDQSESAALTRVFGANMPPVSSTKSFTGHATSAAGAIEAVICLLAMQHGFIPANLGWSHPMPDGITPCMGKSGVVLDHVLCNSFGFGGNDTALLFSRNATSCAALTNAVPDDRIRVAAQVEITDESQLKAISQYVKPLEARRMGKIMKSSLLASLQALQQAGITTPDAVITGTAYGCLENSKKLLRQMTDEGEAMLKPTLFMQSTHNTIGSNIAMRLGCHGYNVTYTQGADSQQWAIRDARMLLKSGQCKTVLVGCHDETTPLFASLFQNHGDESQPPVKSIAIVLTTC